MVSCHWAYLTRDASFSDPPGSLRRARPSADRCLVGPGMRVFRELKHTPGPGVWGCLILSFSPSQPWFSEHRVPGTRAPPSYRHTVGAHVCLLAKGASHRAGDPDPSPYDREPVRQQDDRGARLSGSSDFTPHTAPVLFPDLALWKPSMSHG